jgi:hypothetical protein
MNIIENFLNEFEKSESIFKHQPLILDPCAGGDTKHPMSYPTAIKKIYDDVSMKTLDIRQDSLAETKADYLTYEIKEKPNIIITNPPFNLALPIIKKALDDVADNGFVIMLLRLNFLGSKDRFPFFNECLPKYIYVHHKRISFTEDGSTDSIEYCHMVWQKGLNCKFTMLKVM